ncbi:hypothetical protein [Methylophaga sp. OBS4]|uniref:hypothetical protein n=1 Tax=Methylophaga sp. OBS4 TaxID=2991935 RepID=UPI0022534609|nr:hypothetical protein [Methylophaga sp. OBS4]MCX4186780.1 hypothetical protein [Methylophaga sp. OBS4]
MPEFLFKNNATTTLSGAVADTDTTITVTDGGVFPTPASGKTVRATIERASDNAVEIVDITAISTNDLTVTRAREGTTALAFADGDAIEMRITKEMLEEVAQKSAANEWTGGQSGPPDTLTVDTAPDLTARNNYNLTLTGSNTLPNPSTMPVGQSGYIRVSKTNAGDSLAYGTYWPTTLDDFSGMAVGEKGAIYYSVISSTAIDASTKYPVGP